MSAPLQQEAFECREREKVGNDREGSDRQVGSKKRWEEREEEEEEE